MKVSTTIATLAALTGIHAAPATTSTSCTISSYDASAISAAKSSCSTITINGITVPGGTTLDLTKLKDGTIVNFRGKITFGHSEWAGPLLSISGSGLTVDGTGATLDGLGAQYWDGQGSNGGVKKPKFFYLHSIKSSHVNNMSFLNSPVQLISINGATDLHLSNIHFDNSAGDSGGGHNTDAFDIGSSDGVYIDGATIHNQDDCVGLLMIAAPPAAINSGTNINLSKFTCVGGHGLSIGSVGGRSDNTVAHVTISDSSVADSQNGIRIKTVYGATGSVSDVTYSNIQLSGITKYGIDIQQDYENGSPTGTPTNGVPITGLTLKGVTGTVSSKADNIYVLCGSGSCSGWNWSGINITGGKDVMNYTPSGFKNGGGSSSGSTTTTKAATTTAKTTTTTKAATSTTKAATTTTKAATTTTKSSSGSCAALYGQCGGSGFTGPTCCQSGTCKYSNDWYSQCI
uniref:endo-polygalacturonase n=1 Tax=Rhizophlyctis rosea TaxID=64517 RepID=A0A2U8U9Q3_9FUNG|nr:glycoside hydrolase family 28 [Rhizophlyctis rosea]